MPDSSWKDAPLSPGARKLVESVAAAGDDSDAAALNEWMTEVLSRYPGMASEMAPALDPAAKLAELRSANAQDSQVVAAQSVVDAAVESATARGVETATERDLVSSILKLAGYELSGSSAQNTRATGGTGGGGAGAGSLPTKTLEQYGRDLTAEAAAGKLLPMIGREREIETMIEVLCRTTKRTPVLVGPAGTGKTTIAEGLAQRIVDGQVPDLLKPCRLLTLDVSSLVAGSGIVGEFEKRVEQVLREASQPNILLFIDEMHAMSGAGGRQGSGDLATLLKPPLARGDIACIAATTEDEYRRYIEPDAALERRFSPVYVEELSRDATLEIIRSRAEYLKCVRDVSIDDALLVWIVDFADEFLRNRAFPDKAIDLLEQCVAHAVTHGESQVTQADAVEVTSRMVGLPRSPDEALALVAERLAPLLPEETGAAVSERLQTTLRALDVHSMRPNLVLLLGGAPAGRANAVAEALASSLYASPDRVIEIDLGTMTEDHDITQLIGAPASYVGYGDRLAIHQLTRTPWTVVLLQNVDRCHPSIRSIIASMLADGSIRDAQGKEYFVSDAAVVLAAPTICSASGHRHVGFVVEDCDVSETSAQSDVELALGKSIAEGIDVACVVDSRQCADEAKAHDWVESDLLQGLAQRYLRRGVSVVWDESLVAWLKGTVGKDQGRQSIERLAEEKVAPTVIPFLPETGNVGAVRVVVKYVDGSVQATDK
jgi:ATP-dependent Clp protease ATP-binding subunit ClpC